MKRVNQYFNDRVEYFDGYYPCMQNECNILQVYNWAQLRPTSFFIFLGTPNNPSSISIQITLILLPALKIHCILHMLTI